MANHENLKERTKKFSLRVIKLVGSLPSDETCRIIGRQLLRSATSVGANYRSACRAKSPLDLISRLNTVEEEADESAFWMELLVDSGHLKAAKAAALCEEANELTAIMVASAKTTRNSIANNTAETRINDKRVFRDSTLDIRHSTLG